MTVSPSCLTSICDIDNGGLSLSNRSIATWVKQLQLEGLWLDWARVGFRVNHYVLLIFSRTKLQRTRQLEALGLLGAPIHCGRAVLVAHPNHRNVVDWVRCVEALGALFEHDDTWL